MGSPGSHHAGATAKQASALCQSPTGAAQAGPCREDLGGQVPKGESEGMDTYSFMLHVCDNISTGALQWSGTGSICCSLLGTWFAEPVVKLRSVAREEGCSQNCFLKQIQWEILDKDVCPALFRNTFK